MTVVTVLARPRSHVENPETVRLRDEYVPAVARGIEPDESIRGGLTDRFEGLRVEDNDAALV
jgi:hypothetical protein